MKGMHHSTRAKLLGFLMAYQGREVTTVQLRHEARFEPRQSWVAWAEKSGIKPVRRMKTPNGVSETLVFSVDDLRSLIHDSDSADSKYQESLPIQPATTPRHSLDQVQRDSNASVETLHESICSDFAKMENFLNEDRRIIDDIKDFASLIIERQNKQDNAQRIIFKHVQLLLGQQKLLMQELGVELPAAD